MKKSITILLLFCAASLAAQNQKIDPTVEVNRDYQGKMMEITKGKLDTGIADSLGIFNLDFNYSFFNKPYKDMYEFSAVPSARIPQMETEYIPQLVAKAGIGFPLAPEASILYSPTLGRGNYLNFSGNFNLFKGEVPAISLTGNNKAEENGNKAEAKEYTWGIAGDYTHAWRSGELNLRAGVDGGYSTYYGTILSTGPYTGENYPSSPGYHSYTQVGASIGVKSSGAGKYGQKFNYAARGSFAHTRDKGAGKLQENLFALNGEAGPTVGRYNKFMAGFGVEAVSYGGSADYSAGLYHITPQYRYENGNLKINLGVKLQGEFGNRDKADKYHNFIFPAVDLTFSLLPDNLWLYGTVGGENHLNTYSAALKENPYISPQSTPATLMTGSTPVDIEGGFKGRATDRFSYRAYVGYAIHKGLQQFVYDQDNGWFNTFNSNTREFSAGGEIGINTERLQGGLSARYSSFTKGKESSLMDGIDIVGFPALQGEAFVRYNWNRKVYAGVKCTLRGECSLVTMNGDTGTVPAFAELQAGLEYVHNHIFTFLLRGENLLDAQLQYQPFYAGRGTGFTAGIVVRL